MSLHKDLKDAIHKIATDSKLFHDIVHGNQNATVATEGGVIKTVSKAIHDINIELQANIAAVTSIARDTKAFQEQAKTSEAGAKQACIQALQTIGAVKASTTDIHPGSLKDKLVAGIGMEATLKQTETQEYIELNVAPHLDTASKLYLSANFI